MDIKINLKQNTLKFDIKNNDINVNVSGSIVVNQFKFEWVDPPITRNSPGTPGQMSFDDDYFYICVAQDLWARTILTKGF